jgi:catechol 2,3-dioxygenase-like lactoylglutathione lyase family enzyme
MYNQIGLRVKDLQKAKQLYTAILAPLGHVRGPSSEGYAGFGPKDAPALWLHGTKNGGGAHVALRANTTKEVDQFHAAGLKAGAKDNGAPGIRKDYAPNYYAAFLLDADGNNVEAVCMR